MQKTIPFLLFFLLIAFGCAKDAADLAATGQSGSITRFTVYNGYMYTLNPNGVLTYSLENQDEPELVHTLPTEYGLETIFVYDGNIYLGSRTGLYILEISNPAAPSILSKTDRTQDFFGGCDPVVVKENYAYSTVKIIQNICGTISAQSALLVYDVSNTSAPMQVGTYFLNLPNGLAYKDNYLFVCDEGQNHLIVYDITDPENLSELPQYFVSIEDPIDLIIDGNKMIVATRTDFQIFDISDIESIQRIGSISK